jgi:predicted O-methyltransferase YrrM
MLYRITVAWAYLKTPFMYMMTWVFSSREYTNFTYPLTAMNKQYLSTFVAEITGITAHEANSFLVEVENDDELRQHIRNVTQQSAEARFADAQVEYGRRLGWYALVRAQKPRTVIETGVDKGLGSCVITAALRRNALEGHLGRYYGTDINQKAGYLLCGEYAKYGEILYGDSIASLDQLNLEIDMFINDSDHSAEYESREYDAVETKLSDTAIVIGDNAHCTDRLFRFTQQTNRRFLYFQEKPSKHWYPGGGIGIAYRRGV